MGMGTENFNLQMDLGALSQLMGKVSNDGRERIVETAELKSSFVDPKAISGWMGEERERG